jgi:hypothetical protein
MRSQLPNRYIEEIAGQVGEAEPVRALQSFVCRFRQLGEPLECIATNLGVTRVIEEELPFQGGVFEECGNLVVKINSLSPRIQQRFTLAHEIWHLMLSSVGHGRSRCSCDESLEAACDAIADELLMPAEQAVEFVKRQGRPSPEKLRSIADAFDVPLEAAARRVNKHFKLWRHSIGLWKIETRIREMWVVGRKPWQHKTPRFAAFWRALRTQEAVRTRETFIRGNVVTPVILEVLHLGGGDVLGLLAG